MNESSDDVHGACLDRLLTGESAIGDGIALSGPRAKDVFGGGMVVDQDYVAFVFATALPVFARNLMGDFKDIEFLCFRQDERFELDTYREPIIVAVPF